MNAIRPTKAELLAALHARRKEVAVVAVGLCYLALYLGTTHVKPLGSGGLGGPVEVRVFQDEPHLVVFYPLYLAERWIRNGSLVSASYRFNCDFTDRLYVHSWLWGDGKYSTVWVESWESCWLFLAVGSTVAFIVWKWGRRAPHWAVTCGVFFGFAAVSTVNSVLFRKGQEWNGMTVKQRHGGGPVLHLRKSEPGGGVLSGHRSATRLGGGGSMSGAGEGDYSFEDRVVAIREDSFLMMFRLKRPNKPEETVLIVFHFNQVTETNWNGWHIQGKFL